MKSLLFYTSLLLSCFSYAQNNNCDLSSLKQLINDEDEIARCIIPNPNGGFIVGGGRNEATLLLFFDKNLKLIKEKTFDINATKDPVYGMTIDADNNLIVVGYNEVALLNTGFIFKYDLINDKILWSRDLGDGVYRLLPINVIQNPKNQNYIVCGQIDYYSTQNNDACLFEINKNTGETVEAKFYDMTDQGGDSDAFVNMHLLNNSIYTVGRNTYGAKPGFQGMRFAFSKFDLDKKEQYSKYFFKDNSQDARFYLWSVAEENNMFYTCGMGDYDGVDMRFNCRVYVLCHKEDGSLEWAKQYNLNNNESQRVYKIIKTTKGIFIFGSYIKSGNQNAYIMYLNNNGNVQWAKSLDFGENDEIYSATMVNDEIVFVGKSLKNAKGDVIIGKVSTDGIFAPSCKVWENFNVSTTSLPTTTFAKPFSSYDSNITNNNINAKEGIAASYQEKSICESTPVDIRLKSILAKCNTDSLISIEICNNDAGEFMESIPVHFYLQNPFNQSVKSIARINVAVQLNKNECKFFTIKAPMHSAGKVYVVINDNGQKATPYNNSVRLNDFSNECIFSNNIGHFQLKAVSLDLDKNITSCKGDSILLNAKGVKATWSADNQLIICQNCDKIKVAPSAKTPYFLKATWQGCAVEDTIFVTPIAINLNLRSDTLICKNDTLLLKSNQDFDTYIWKKDKQVLNCTQCKTLKIIGDNTQHFYELEVKKGQCTTKDEVLIGAEDADFCETCKNGRMYLPNIFSPNQDGVNDEFFPFSSECGVFVKEFRIYDLWGNEVYVEKDFPMNEPKYSWKGKHKDRDAQEGIYVYYIIIETKEKKSVKKSGNVMLLR